MLPLVRKPALAVDIGSHSVKVLELRRTRGGSRVVGAAELLLPDLDEGSRLDGATSVLMEYLSSRRLRSTRMLLAAPADRVWMRSVPEHGILDDRMIQSMLRNNAVTRIFPDLDPSQRFVIDWQILDQNPADRVTEVLYVAMPEAQVREYRRVAELLRQVPGLLDVSTFCLARLVPAEGWQLILHVGRRGTEVVAVQDGRIFYSDRIGFGGDELLGTIQRVSGGSRVFAETHLTNHGILHGSDHLRQALGSYLRSGIVRYVAEMTAHMAREHRTPSFRFDHIWLSGGVGRAKGLAAALQSLLGMPVSVLDPFARLEVDAALADDPDFRAQAPLFAVAAGLALREGE